MTRKTQKLKRSILAKKNKKSRNSKSKTKQKFFFHAFLQTLSFHPSVFDIKVTPSFFKDHVLPLKHGKIHSSKNPLLLIQKIHKDKGKKGYQQIKKFLPEENVIDIHIFLIMCAVFYYNKPMKKIISIVLNINEIEIDHAIKYTIEPYVKSRIKVLKGGSIVKHIQLLFLALTICFTSIVFYRFQCSQKDLVDTIFHGSLSEGLSKVTDAIEILHNTNTCQLKSTPYTVKDSFQTQLVKWAHPEALEIYGKFVNVIKCMASEKKSVRLIGELVMMNINGDPIEEKEDEEEENEEVEEEEEDKEIEKGMFYLPAVTSQSGRSDSFIFALTADESRMIDGFDTLNEKALVLVETKTLNIQEKAMEYFLPKKGAKVTEKNNFKAGLNYLESFVEDDDQLANAILDNELFALYQKEKEMKYGTYTDNDTEKVTIKNDGPNTISDSIVFFGSILGTAFVNMAYDMVTNPSHTPVLDMIDNIRGKMVAFSRSMRDSYNKNSDLLEDMFMNIKKVQEKATAAWTQACYITALFQILIAQIIAYLYMLRKEPLLLKNKSDSDTRKRIQ